MKRLLLVAVLISFTGCFAADRSGIGAIGADHKVQLYSGGNLVREWESNGKVISESNSDGYYFQDKETKRLVRVTGDLVITPIE